MKFTSRDTRAPIPTMDYILSNWKLHPAQVILCQIDKAECITNLRAEKVQKETTHLPKETNRKNVKYTHRLERSSQRSWIKITWNIFKSEKDTLDGREVNKKKSVAKGKDSKPSIENIAAELISPYSIQFNNKWNHQDR